MFSDWVDSCKSSVLQSSEWKRVSQELHAILSDKLSRDCVGFFADLSFDEQLAYIKQIKRYDLKDTQIYDDFLDKLRELIEKYISIQVEKLEESDNINLTKLTRLDKILHITSEGTAKLLHDFPQNEIQNQLSGLANMSLSPNLRKEIWKLLLFNNQKYEDDEQSIDSSRTFSVAINTQNNISSVNTFRITEKCENILLTLSQIIEVPNINPTQTSPGFGDLNTLLPLIKNVMIKYHEDIGFFNNENSTLCDQRYFYLIIPILVCITDFLIESITNKINMYNLFQFKASKWFKQLIQTNIPNTTTIDNQFDINLDSIRFGTEIYAKYYKELEGLIIYKSPMLLDALQHIAVSDQLMMDDDADKTQLNWIKAIIEPIIEEMIEYWFVTLVNIETCLHIWDQLMLKRFETLPLILCSLLNIITHHIKDCQNVDGFINVTKRFLPTIHYTHFMKQMQIIKYYKPNLSNRSRSMPQNIDIDDEKKEEITIESTTIEMLQSPKQEIATVCDVKVGSSISVQNKKLFAGIMMVGKLQRIRESVQQISPTQEEEKQIVVQHESNKENDEKKEENCSSTKTVTALVVEECIVQILRGFREISNL